MTPAVSSVETPLNVIAPASARPSIAPYVFFSPTVVPRIGAVLISASGTKDLAQFPQWKTAHLSGSSAQLLFQSTRMLGVVDASCRAYMETTPVMSISHADGTSWLLIMLMRVQALTPKFFWMEVQH